MDRVILHSDINCCYASIEHLHHPELDGKPVAVAGEQEKRHGIILAADYECKKYGVKTTMPIWQAKKLCPEMTVLPPRMDMYSRYANQVRMIYYEYSDRVEPFGMDESWIDVTECCRERIAGRGAAENGAAAGTYSSKEQQDILMDEGYRLALEINRRVREEIGITVSIGVSWNKVFAKLGSDYKKPDGVTLFGRRQFDTIRSLPADSLLYVGKSMRKHLDEMGIRTIGHLADTPEYVLVRTLGKAGHMLGVYARGEDDEPVRVEGTDPEAKSVGNSTTIAHDFSNNEEVKHIIYELSCKIAGRMRRKGVRCSVVELWLRDAKLSCMTRQRKLEIPTDTERDIAGAAYELFLENYDWKEPLRSVGVRGSGLRNADEPVQLSLFQDYAAMEKKRRLNEALDAIRGKYGNDSVQLGTNYCANRGEEGTE